MVPRCQQPPYHKLWSSSVGFLDAANTDVAHEGFAYIRLNVTYQSILMFGRVKRFKMQQRRHKVEVPLI